MSVNTKITLSATDPADVYASPTLEFSKVQDPNESLIQITDGTFTYQVNAEDLKEVLRRIDIVLASA